MALIHRRAFIERLSLGAGAWLLSPIVKTLVAEAQGTVSVRKRFIVFIQGNGFPPSRLAPPEIDKATRDSRDFFQTTNFTVPEPLAALAPYKNRMLLVDGLVNQQGKAGHCGQHVFMSCVPPFAPTGDGTGGLSGGITFDQHVANALGRNTAFRSVHLGAKTAVGAEGKADNTSLIASWYARQRGESIPVSLIPSEAYTQILGGVGGGSQGSPAAGESERKAILAAKQKVLDFVRDDIKRVKDRLAAPERNKLDEYLGAVQEATSRLATSSPAPANCGGGAKSADPEHPEERFAAMVDIGTAALACGLTNVLTLNFSGLGFAFRTFGCVDSLHQFGHGQAKGPFGMSQHTAFYVKQLVRMLDRLSALKEGDRSIFDNSVLIASSDNGEAHHGRGWRWPVLVVGNAGGGLKADGRYVKYPARYPNNNSAAVPVNVAPDQRPVGDLFSTLGHALGAPIDDFGKAGLERIQGPLAELMP